jgi:hypothetical protein
VASGARGALLQVVTARLALDITSGALTMVTVGADGPWPTEYPYFLSLEEGTDRWEIVRVDNTAGQTHTIVRGQQGTTAAVHKADASVHLNLTRGDLARLLARLEQLLGGGAGTPGNTVVSETTYGLSPTAGVDTDFSREDHSHGSPTLSAAAPTTSAVGDAAANGSATTPAKADHLHGREAFGGTPAASAVGDAGAAGVAATPSRSDHKHGREVYGSPVASGVGDTGNDGVATTNARADHRHQREAFGAVLAATTYGVASSNGVATTDARSDHQHGSVPKHSQEITFTRTGALSAPIVGAIRWYPGRAITIIAVRASVGTAPVGGSVIADVNKNGTTIFTTQSNRPTIAAGTFTDLADAINVAAVGAGEYLTADVDQVGPTTPGSDLAVTVVYTVD